MVQNVFIEECAKNHKQKSSFGIDFEQNVEYVEYEHWYRPVTAKSTFCDEISL